MVFVIMNTVLFLLSAAVCFYYRQTLPYFHSNLWIIASLFFAAAYIVSHSGIDGGNVFLLKVLAWIGNLWLGFVFYSLLWMLLHGVVRLLFKLFGGEFACGSYFAAAGCVLITLVLAVGVYRAFSPVVRYESFAAQKPIAADTRIVLISDLHLGHILDADYARKMAERINAQKPDLVLIAGDIVDERLNPVIKNRALEQLENINAPLGVYGAFGNHDYLDGKENELAKMLQDEHIRILQNETVVLDSSIKITGLTDYSRYRGESAVSELAEDNDRYYSIIIDHQPRKIFAMQESGYDLALSGHTHAGQLWPFNFVTENMYPLDYGKKQFGKMTAIVSGGYGFWGIPIRTTAPRPEFVVIDIKKN